MTEGLQKDFGEHRVIDSPLAESGIIGTAVGMAIRGYRPVCEIQFDGLRLPGVRPDRQPGRQDVLPLAGHVKMPMVIRIPFGGGIGAVEHHSESPEAYFVHTPGLKVVACSNPVDAYWMIQQAVASDDPVIFFEPKRRYPEKGRGGRAATPPPLHSSQVVRPGSDVDAGHLRSRWCGPAWPQRRRRRGRRDLEVIDLRSLSPLDLGPVVRRRRKTGRWSWCTRRRSPSGWVRSGGAGHRAVLLPLEAPVLRVTGFDLPYPPSRVEDEYLPDLDRVLDAVDRSLAY